MITVFNGNANANVVGNVLGDGTIDALIALRISSFEFQLTGSRFFGTSNSNSDFDFFTEDPAGAVADYLESEGFKLQKAPLPLYQDGFTSYVYRKGRVDVQIVNNAELKTFIQNEIINSQAVESLYHLPKLLRVDFWRLLYAVAEGARQ
jgi:hypothetical protein